MDLGSFSTSERIVAPVVVKPETLSKKASVKEGIAPEMMKGKVPKKLAAIQAAATIKKDSFGVKENFFPLEKAKIIPVIKMQKRPG